MMHVVNVIEQHRVVFFGGSWARWSGAGGAASVGTWMQDERGHAAGARGARCLHAEHGRACAIDGWAGRGGAGPARRLSPVRLGAASARSSPVPAVRRAGVSPRVPGGGGEPRAARPRADVARSRSVPVARSSPGHRRRARSLAAGHALEPPVPRLRPVFLWARQSEGTVQEVRCEDYDPRNRIRITRTATGWRVIPRTEIYNSIRVPLAPPLPFSRERKERRRRRRYGKSKRRNTSDSTSGWLVPDLETHIPSHTIAVPRVPPPRSPLPPAPAEPTPLDNLLAVAELELNQQRGKEALELELEASGSAPYTFLPAEAVARDVMSFELGEPPKTDVEDAFPSNMGVHKDLFETISEAHYLPDLSGPHDEALLDSLVEKGCEDNQILGQALDKLAHLVHGSGDYAEEEEDMLLSGAPVADIIDRLEHSLESPGRSSITAAQGLLHLHHIGDHMAPPEHQQSVEQYMAEEVYTAEPSAEHAMETMDAETKLEENGEVEHLVDYDPNADKRLIDEVEHDDVLYNEPVPEAHETYDDDKTNDEQLEHSEALPDQSEIAMTAEMPQDDISTDIGEQEDSQHANDLDNNETCDTNEQESILDVTQNETVDYDDKGEDDSNKDDLLPTDLSIKQVKNILPIISNNMEEIANTIEDNMSEKSDEQPKDLSVHKRLPTPHASPRRIEIPRAPSRESDAMQSPQPSGIPAIPSSPEIFTMPQTKSKQTLFLETLLSSPSPKMYTSEVTITKQQCEPLNLGKHRKSASPTVSSCSDEMRKLNKEFGEPEEKKSKKDGAEDNLVKISKVFNKSGDDHVSYSKHNKESSSHKSTDSIPPLKQLQMLKTSLEFHLPDPLLIPKDRLNHILAAPGREIPALLLQRPELRLPEAFAFPAVLQDPDILVISLSQLENILENDLKSQNDKSNYSKETSKPTTTTSTTSSTDKSSTPQPDQTSHPKPIPSMDALAGDIDAATSAALNQMIWLPYLSQLEAMAACSQNMDFLKALNSSGYTGPNYPDLSQMFNPSARFMGSGGFPMMPPMDYDNRLQFAMWQEAVNHANAAASQRPKANSAETMKDMTSKSSDVQNPYVHSTKNQQSKTHSSARTSPIAHNYNNQRSMPHHPFLQGMYPGMNANMRPNMPLPGLQIPYFNPNMMGNQRGPRSGQQKSPTSPYYPNNNYLNSVKHSEAQSHHRSSGGNERNSQESNRPRISVKSLQNLLEPTAAAASGGVGTSRRSSNPPVPSISRRRDEPEVGSTTPLGEPPPHLTPHPHDPSSFHLWHPLFGNQKSYNSPWSWTTVTATGD